MRSLDPRDVVGLVGFGALETGLWMVEPAVALIAGGALMLATATLPPLLALVRGGQPRRER